MCEGERVGAGLNMHLPGHFEHRFEPNAFLANVALAAHFGALPDVADGPQVCLIEAIFVAVDDDAIMVDSEDNVRLMTAFRRPLKRIVVGILKKLEDEPYILRVQFLCQATRS